VGYHDVQFPTTLSEGYRGGPSFNTIVTETDSGHEERVSRWQSARWVYRAARDMGTVAEANALRDFFLARGGALNSFRFKDWLDFTSETTGITVGSIGNDQVIGTGDGTTVNFQLRKQYTSGSQTYVRTISLPVAGTVVIYDNGSIVGGWSVNTTTGLVTFSVAPAAAHVISAGFQFDVPVRFDVQAEQGAQFRIETYQVHTLVEIPLIEVKDETPYFEGWDPGGSYIDAAMAADLSLSMALCRLVVLTPTAARNVFLPPPGNLGSGGPYFKIVNQSGSFTLTVRDDAGTSVVVVGTSSNKELWLLESGSTKTWVAV
jgi:uncharacterized protein (TIGR02217 family)